MFRPFALGLVLAAVVALAPGASAERDPGWSTGGDPRACSAPIWPERLASGSPGLGRRVLVIGDSLVRESAASIQRGLRDSGWTPTIRCFGGKRLDWALAQIARAKEIDQLPDIVVIAVGTNDMRWIARDVTWARMERVVRSLGKRTVVWVDTYASGADRFTKDKQRWINRRIGDVDRRYPNVHRVRWGAYAEAAGVRFRDGLHYDAEGRRAFAARLVDTVNRVGG